MSYGRVNKEETNSSVQRKQHRRAVTQARCSFCPPNKGCNSKGTWRKHGYRKPKYKNKRG